MINVGGRDVNPADIVPDPSFKPVDLDPAPEEGWRAWAVVKSCRRTGWPRSSAR